MVPKYKGDQRRIQDSPPGGRQHTTLSNFPENCMKSKEFGRPGGRGLAPPRSATGDILLVNLAAPTCPNLKPCKQEIGWDWVGTRTVWGTAPCCGTAPGWRRGWWSVHEEMLNLCCEAKVCGVLRVTSLEGRVTGW